MIRGTKSMASQERTVKFCIQTLQVNVDLQKKWFTNSYDSAENQHAAEEAS